MPPGGGNPNPPPNSIIFREFATWSHLPPPYLPGVNIHEGDPATAPRKIITSIDGIYPNTMRDTPSPPSEQTLIQDTGASGAEEGFSTPTEPYREMCIRGPENDWKPCSNWTDSGNKYPGGPVFPEPEGGFSKEDNEKCDFFRSVMDWWQGHDYSTADLISWVSEALDHRRQYEILNYWVQYKLPPGMHRGIDMSTLGPEFEELVERANALQAERADEGGEGAKGGERPMWKYRDIEPGEEANQDWRE